MKINYELERGYIDIWNEESEEWDRYIKVNKESVVEEEKKIEFKNIQGLNTDICTFKRYDITDKKNKSFAISNIQNDFEVIGNTINELINNQKKIIDYLKSKGE